MNQAGICGSSEVCERHHCFQKNGDYLGDSEASAPQSCLVYRSRQFYSNVKRERGEKPTVALACDKAALTTDNYFDHNLHLMEQK